MELKCDYGGAGKQNKEVKIQNYLTFSVKKELLSKTFGLFRVAKIVGHVVFDLGARFDFAQEINKCRYVHLINVCQMRCEKMLISHKQKNLYVFFLTINMKIV